MKRQFFLKQISAAGLAAASAAAARTEALNAIVSGSVRATELATPAFSETVVAPILADAEMQFGYLGSVSAMFRGPLTREAAREAFRSSEVQSLRVMMKPGCVGVGWRYSAEVERNVAQIDARAESWLSEDHFVEYIETFFRRGGISASRLLGSVLRRTRHG